MTSRDEALKLARMHVSGEAYGRLVAGDAYVLARALIESEEECKNLRASVEVWRRALEDGIRREEVRDG